MFWDILSGCTGVDKYFNVLLVIVLLLHLFHNCLYCWVIWAVLGDCSGVSKCFWVF